MLRIKYFAILALTLFVLISSKPSLAQTGLRVTYGGQGVQTLSYQGVVLEDLSQNASNVFHISHMKMTDLRGNPATCPECGWGENNHGKSWNAATQDMDLRLQLGIHRRPVSTVRQHAEHKCHRDEPG